uniref:Uncharacterized protein n=1 Tax=Dulem virus 54 TaxID=3145765 RepID=A0AAU8B403_9VIRU
MNIFNPVESDNFSEVGNGWTGCYLSKDLYEENALILKRVVGNPEPDNKFLGALVLDVDQAALLLQVIEEHEKAYKMERRAVNMLNHAHDSISMIYKFLENVVIEAHKQ